MKVLLIQDVKKLGKKGEVVDVSDGYAKNYLMPQKLGVEATKSVLNEVELKKGSDANRRAKERAAALELSSSLTEKKIILKSKAGADGRLFGSITSKEIADAAAEQFGVAVDKKKIVMKDAIKTTGAHEVVLKLYTDISAKLTVIVEGEDA